MRQERAGGFFHVTARGNNRELLFVDAPDFERYLKMLASVVVDKRWRCLSYCLMPNHIHLLLQTREPNLGRGMQRLHGNYALTFNKRHGRCGHVFQGRYDAVPIENDPQLWMAALYVARNPVRAGLCSRPEDWPWSSHRAVVEQACPAWLDGERLIALIVGMWGGSRRDFAARAAAA